MIGAFLPFVARAGVLAELDTALAAARAGRGGLLLVTGEPGIGKTRLVQEAADRAEGFGLIWTWCPSAAGQEALHPWSRAVRGLAAADATAARLVRASPFLAGLAGVAGPDGGADADPRDPEGARSQLALDLADVFAAAAAHEPVLLIVDDLHQAGGSALRLLADLAPALRSMRAVVLATARDGDRAWHGRAEARGTLARAGTVIPLRPFGADDIAALVAGAIGAAPPPDLVGVVAERSGGNPFLATELARLLADGAAGGADGAVGLDAVRAVVPDPVRVIAAARLAELPERTRQPLAAAAVLGTRFRLDVLAELIDLPLGELPGALADGHAAGLLVAGEAGEDRFRHDLVRDAIYDAVPPGAREDLHARAGDVLAGHAERGRGVAAAEVAYHLLRAGHAAAARGVAYARLAGDRALAALAFEDAVHWYQRADASLAALRAGDADRADAALALGGARLAAGDATGARAEFLRAAGLARQAGRPDLLAAAALGFGGPAGFEIGLLDGEQISLLEEARAALPAGQDALLALVTARLSVAATLVTPDARRLELATEAVRLARAAGDDAVLAAALAALCDANAGPDHCADRLTHATEIIELAGRLRDPVLGLLGRRLRLVALLETGAIADWDADALAYRTAAAALRHPLYSWYVPLWRGMRALAEGRHAECREANDEAAAIGARAASGNAEVLAATQLWCLLAEAGETEELAGMLARLEEAELGGVWPQVTRSLVLAQIGRTGDSRAQLDAVAPLLASMPRDSEWLPAVAQVAEIIAIIGPHPAGRWARDVLEPYASLFAVEGICAAVRGPVHRHLALLATSLGEHEAAAAHRAAAIELSRAIGATALAARIERESGEGTAAAVTGPAGPAGAAGPDAAAGPGAGVAAGSVFRRDGEVWTLRYGGREVRLRDSKGLRDLGVLLATPGVAVAALDLAAAGSAMGSAARAGSAGPHARADGLHAPGDAGELIDAQARRAYQQRLRDLEEAAAEADAAGDAERGSRIAVEREALVEALTQAYGLGGRARRAGSAAERARTAVTARLKDAIRRIGDAHPELGRHLTRSVRTGTFCVYEPDQPVRWSR